MLASTETDSLLVMTTTIREVQDLEDLEALALSQEKKRTCLAQEAILQDSPQIQATLTIPTIKDNLPAIRTIQATFQATQVFLETAIPVLQTTLLWEFRPIIMGVMARQTIPI